MRRSRTVAAVTGILVALHVGKGVAEEAPPIALDAYAIYNPLLQAWVNRDERATVSVVRFTRLGSTDCLDEVDRSPRWISAAADLRRRNASTYAIEPKFVVPFRYELSDTMEQIGGLLPPPPDESAAEHLRDQMARLEDMGRRHFSQVALSAPGISSDGRLAIVYVATSFAGAFYVLRKAGTRWVVQPETRCRWIS